MRRVIVTYKKLIVIALSVLIYLVVLVLVNFTHTTKYAAGGESLIHNEEFDIWVGEGKTWADNTGLHFHDAQSGEKTLASSISLESLQQIQVNFCVQCPEDFAETSVLHVDLWADGYDTDEQEFTVELKAGKNEIEQVIDKGDNAPQEAYVRVFCLDSVQCDISDLSVKKMEKVEHKIGIGICAGIISILAIALVIVLVLRGEKGRN